MQLRHLACAAALALALGPQAMAASAQGTPMPATTTKTKTPAMSRVAHAAARCVRLERQLENALHHTRAPADRVATARRLDREGTHLCQIGHQKGGIRKLEAALRELGIRPADA